MRRTAQAAAIGAVLWAVSLTRSAEKFPVHPLAGIGYELPGLAAVSETRPLPIGDPSASAASPLYLRVEVLWAEVETKPGEYNWRAADTVVDRFRASQHEVILNFWGSNPLYSDDILKPPTVLEPKLVDAWTGFVREAARHFKGRVRFFEFGKGPNAPGLWGGADAVKSYAFLIKKTAVIVRAEAKDAVIVVGGLIGADAEWLGALYAQGAAPYIDVVPFRPDARKDLGAQCDTMQATILAKDASAKLWLEGVPITGSGEEGGRQMLRTLLTAFDHGVGLVTFALPYGTAGTPLGVEYLVRAHSAIGEGLGRVPSSDRLSVNDASGAPLAGVRAVAFYEPEHGLSVIGLWTDQSGPPGKGLVKLTARRPGPPTLYDPISGLQSQPAFEADPQGAHGEIQVGPSPVFLLYREGVGAASIPEGTESLEVTAKGLITADEVIAKYREFQAAQDARLAHYRSDAMINFHFRIAGYSQTVDVGMGGSYFYDPKGGAEWELRDYYLLGNKSKWKDFPELPFVQPEKVVTLPLDITFDRSYSYEYEGEDSVEGRPCYVLSFVPVDPTKTLYRGRVWIDKVRWARVRIDSIQTKLEPPFLSSEERTTFAPLAGPDGNEYWLIARIDGQQIYSAAGMNLVILRDIVFTNHKINDPDFAASHEEAYKSNHQILRDTEKGFRYVEKTKTGERKVKAEEDTNQFFGLGGVLYDPSLDHPLPLVGVNYFDYDFKKLGIQTNCFFAGAYLNLNVTDPNFGKSGFDLGGDLSLSAITRTDKEFEDGQEVSERNVKTRSQSISMSLGREIGNFLKLRTTYELAYQAYGPADDTAASFAVPKDTLVQSSILSGTFSRWGYEVRLAGTYAVRETFTFWGRPSGEDFNPDAQSFLRYEGGVSKEFFLPAFQKLRFGIEGFGGNDLDRFSRYSFDRFSARVRGFAGSGVRFDQGAILRGAYLFNVAGLVRFEAALDYARVKAKGADVESTSHTGLGIAANILGPWKTVWQLDYGYALRSNIKPVQGDQEVLLIVLKLF